MKDKDGGGDRLVTLLKLMAQATPSQNKSLRVHTTMTVVAAAATRGGGGDSAHVYARFIDDPQARTTIAYECGGRTTFGEAAVAAVAPQPLTDSDTGDTRWGIDG